MKRTSSIVMALVWVSVLASPAHAVIIKKVTLKDLMQVSTHVAMMKVDRVDPDRPSMVLVAETDLKGKLEHRRIPMNLKGDRFAEMLKHTPELLKRVAKDLPILVFIQEKEDQVIAFAFTNGTWFQFRGDKVKDEFRWSFLHCETYFRRTFKGDTKELRQIVEDALAKKKELPAYNEKEEPGFGPEIKKEGSSRLRTGGPLFGVVFMGPVGGVIGGLALLFPAVFGGLMILMRRWVALLTVVFTNSTLFTLHLLFVDDLRSSWWGSQTALWLCVLLVNLLGVLWSWQRWSRSFALGELGEQAEAPMPVRTENITMSAVTAAGAIGTGCYYIWGTPILGDATWVYLLSTTGAFLAGSLYLTYLRCRQAAQPGSVALVPTDGVVLWAMLGLTLLLTYQGRGASEGQVFPESEEITRGAKLKKEVWQFIPEGSAQSSSSPVLAGDRLYVGLIHGDAFDSSGALYCLERATGKKLWVFNNKGGNSIKNSEGKAVALKQMHSSPCVADGLVFIGEGFHTDFAGRLFCLDAKDGAVKWAFDTAEEDELWPFATNSHIESTPFVADGKVYFGAGDKGIYCLEARTKKKLWQFPPPPKKGERKMGLHVDSSPIVVDGKVYCTAGRSQTFETPAVFCLDAATGKQLWRQDAIDLPAWATPVYDRGRVYVGLGNGRLTEPDAKDPRGAVLCLDAKTGNRIWEFKTKDAVHVRPAIDRHHLYVTSRDGNCYALDLREGHEVWKQPLGSPAVADPALARCTWSGAPTSLYVAGTDGKVSCLDPETGKVFWEYDDLFKNAAQLLGGLSVGVRRTPDGDVRRIYLVSSVNSSAQAVVMCLEDQWVSDVPEGEQ